MHWHLSLGLHPLPQHMVCEWCVINGSILGDFRKLYLLIYFHTTFIQQEQETYFLYICHQVG